MSRRTGDAKFTFYKSNYHAPGTECCNYCKKDFEDGETVFICMSGAIENWNPIDKHHEIPIRHPNYHMGCYFLLKTQGKLPTNYENFKNYAEATNRYMRIDKEREKKNRLEFIMSKRKKS